MRTMYDSTSARDIPGNAAMVAGYVDGLYTWSDADWRRFPTALKVRIACFASTDDGHVLDVENGDALPIQAPGWAQRRRAAGIDPTVYVNLSNWSAVITAFHAAGVDPPHYWLADYDGQAVIPAGCIAKQYADPPISGGHYDLSAVADYWPGVDSAEGADNMTQQEFDALLAGNKDFEALIYRIHAILNNLPTVVGGPLKGEVNALRAELDAIKASAGGPGSLPAGTTFQATVK